MKKNLYMFLFLLIAIVGCEQEEFPGSGLESLRDFTLTPVPNSKIALNSIDPEGPIVLSWQEASSGFDSPVLYTWMLDEKGGDFSSPVLSVPADNDGETNSVTLTNEMLEDALAAAGVQPKAEMEGIWKVTATNGDVTKSSAAQVLTIMRYSEAVMTFDLTSPATDETIFLKTDLANEGVVFAWSPTISGIGTPVKYEWLADELDGDFSQPVVAMESDNNGANPTFTLTHQEWEEILIAQEIGEIDKIDLKWTVRAYAGDVEQMSGDIFNVSIFRMEASNVVELTFELKSYAPIPEGFDVFLAGSFGDLGFESASWNEPGTNPDLKLTKGDDNVYRKKFLVKKTQGQTSISYKYFLAPTGNHAWSHGEQSFSADGCQGLHGGAEGGDRKFTYSLGDGSPKFVESNVVTWEGFCFEDSEDRARIEVTVPGTTPTNKDVYITGNLKFAGAAGFSSEWKQPGTNPAFRMRPVGGQPNTFEIFLPLKKGEEIEFKFFLATTESPNWGNGEQRINDGGDGCQGVDNRKFTFTGANEFVGTVGSWEGFCPF